jgi:hypothetical protein
MRPKGQFLLNFVIVNFMSTFHSSLHVKIFCQLYKTNQRRYLKGVFFAHFCLAST